MLELLSKNAKKSRQHVKMHTFHVHKSQPYNMSKRPLPKDKKYIFLTKMLELLSTMSSKADST